MDGTSKKQDIRDCLIYYSKKDDRWIAHGLYTDQIGTGKCVLDAYVDYLQGMQDLYELNKKVGDIEIFRAAPKVIFTRAKTAQLLPKELYEVAYKRVHGDWPKDLKVTTEPLRHHSLRVKVSELVQIA